MSLHIETRADLEYLDPRSRSRNRPQISSLSTLPVQQQGPETKKMWELSGPEINLHIIAFQNQESSHKPVTNANRPARSPTAEAMPSS